jgi:short-subunit dehydrogenase
LNGKWALITGASAGIGRELADLFAADGFSLVLVARSEGRLREMAARLEAAHRIESRVLPKDLGQPAVGDEIFEATRDLPISVLVNNAGFGSFGPFAQTDLAVQTSVMHVNMVALTQMSHLFLQPMLERRQGRILNVASTAAFQPGPLMNVYYASKAFVYSFSYALADELAGTGVTVTALCPGTTRTEFFDRARMRPRQGWPMMDARKAAEAGYHGLMKGKRVVIPGLFNNLLSFLAKRTPPRLTSAVVRRINEGARG